MSWTFEGFDADLDHLAPQVKAKAIEIANVLVKENGYSKEMAIVEAIKRAEEWFKDLGA